MNAETVDKELNVLAVLEMTNEMRATILRCYPNIFDVAYKLKRTHVYSWKKAHQKLRAAAQANKGGHRKIRDKGTATLLAYELENEIVRFVNELRKEGVPVSTTILTMQEKKASAEVAVSPFTVFFEYIPEKTLNKGGERTVWFKCGGASKNRATVMLLGDSTGNRYPPLVVFKTVSAKDLTTQAANTKMRDGFGKKVWSEIKPLRGLFGMSIHTNSKGWWNGGLSVEFLTFYFGGRTTPNEPIRLLWDDPSGHWTAEVRECTKFLNIVLLKVPPHATAVSQPTDVAWNFPFKSNLRCCWLDNLQD